MTTPQFNERRAAGIDQLLEQWRVNAIPEYQAFRVPHPIAPPGLRPPGRLEKLGQSVLHQVPAILGHSPALRTRLDIARQLYQPQLGARINLMMSTAAGVPTMPATLIRFALFCALHFAVVGTALALASL